MTATKRSQDMNPSKQRSLRRVGIAAVLLVACAAGWYWLGTPIARRPARPNDRGLTVLPQLDVARKHLSERRWDEALRAAREILQTDPDQAVALLIAGEASSRLERYREALEFYRQVPPSAGADYLSATLAAAEIQRVAGSLDQAEALYRRALSVDARHVLALDRLATLLKLTGRHREARTVLLQMLALGAGQVQHLRWLADPTHPLQAEDVLKRSLRVAPDQIFARVGQAELRWVAGETTEALRVLNELRAAQPQHPAIEVLYARCLWDDRNLDALAAWQETLAEPLYDDAEIWHLLGLLNESQDQPR
ncbi:MAG TPA: tetratricopeptide repeat protein, partial [Planctomycetaceae bacterium]|nr:tetratricopeptide repeat protein [Planctomycetaceae bacterium]